MTKSKSKKMVEFVVGIDEVGRGPLAGPVSVVSLLMTKQNYSKLKKSKKLEGLHNSKKLSEKQREEWFELIKEWQKVGLLDFAYVSVSAKEIDSKGIVAGLNKCILKTLEALDVTNDSDILLDGSLHAPEKYKNQKTIIGGDETEPVISLASIVAKVTRDEHMKKISLEYPEYDLEGNKGYGTEKHRKAIKKYGLTEVHRKSFCGKLGGK